MTRMVWLRWKACILPMNRWWIPDELEFKSQMQFLEIKTSNRDEVFLLGFPADLTQWDEGRIKTWNWRTEETMQRFRALAALIVDLSSVPSTSQQLTTTSSRGSSSSSGLCGQGALILCAYMHIYKYIRANTILIYTEKIKLNSWYHKVVKYKQSNGGGWGMGRVDKQNRAPEWSNPLTRAQKREKQDKRKDCNRKWPEHLPSVCKTLGLIPAWKN